MEIWAKSDGETLKEHTEKVKNEIKNLIKNVTSFYLPNDGLFKEIVSDTNRKSEFLILLELVATYHDMGKISPRFQNTVHNPDFPYTDVMNFPDVPHSFLSPAFFNKEKIKNFKNLAGFLGFNWREFLKIVLSAVAFHHWRENYAQKFLNKWRLVEKTVEELKNCNEFIDELKAIDSEIAIDFGSHYNKLLIPPDNLAFLIKELEQDLSKKQKNFFILLKGFLHRADHFASSNIQNGIEIDPLQSIKVEDKVKNEIKRRAKEKCKIEIKDKDIWQLEKIKGVENNNIFLKATTGIGKTEFALLWSSGKKLIYVLPIRTAVNAMWKRLRNIFGDDKIGLLHSDALFYLEDIKDQSRDENISESFISYDLARNLSYPVIVATADQFFVAGLKYPGYEKIFATLAYSYIVLDEIQLYDPRIAAIIIKTLEEVTKLGAKFCIMSATLPEFYRNKMKERGIYFEEREFFPKNLKKHKIELLENGIVINDDKNHEYMFNEEVGDKIKKFVEKGKKVLIILNTIKAAKEVYEKLKDNFKSREVLLIHSQFTMQDRKEKEEIFESENKLYPDILIATQVAEVSLDIDYDILFTELAPLDALFQRMGRVLRRFRENYEYSEAEPNIYVCGRLDSDKVENVSGVGSVYRADVLRKTYELLKSKNKKILDEGGKIKIIEQFYEELEKIETYFSKFEEMLEILDSFFSVDSRKKAQDIFRNIIQISGIPENKKVNFQEEIEAQIKQMYDLIIDYSNFFKKWKNEWKNSEAGTRKELKEKMRKKLIEYKDERRKINHTVFKSLSNWLVHLYPDEKIEKSNLIFEVEKLIKDNNNKEIKSALRKWLFQTFEGIYLFENVEYDSEKGAIVKEGTKNEVIL
ncbi:MAG: CRISPR-associated helicase Cas3' [Candidatus Omnitrophica bacterium]|nr:CRISPR-associated helicase Cas3' [Candidatus Omnitrophota bacterium]